VIIGIFALLVFLATVFDIYLEAKQSLGGFDKKKVNPEIEMKCKADQKQQDLTLNESTEKEKPLEISINNFCFV